MLTEVAYFFRNQGCQYSSMPQSEKITIFGAGDEPEERAVVQQVIGNRFSQIELRFFTNGIDLVDALRDAEFIDRLPHLVVLDLNMPEGAGRDVLRLLGNSKEFSQVPVVLFSGSTNKMDAFYLSFYKARRIDKPANPANTSR